MGKYLLSGFYLLLFLVLLTYNVFSAPCTEVITITDGGACFGGCAADTCTGVETDNASGVDCTVSTTTNPGDWTCHVSGVYYSPEFAPIPGLFTFLSSLGIPYWLFRRKKIKL